MKMIMILKEWINKIIAVSRHNITTLDTGISPSGKFSKNIRMESTQCKILLMFKCISFLSFSLE